MGHGTASPWIWIRLAALTALVTLPGCTSRTPEVPAVPTPPELAGTPRNQPGLYRQFKALPWRQVPAGDDTRNRGHGRDEIRRLQVLTITGLTFPRCRPSDHPPSEQWPPYATWPSASCATTAAVS
jgi:hypothetical protein